MNRREALVSLGLTTLSGVAWSKTWSSTASGLLQAAVAPANVPATITPADNAIDHRLREDMEHLSSRVNSEEGIQMILACDNLVPDPRTHKLTTPALMPLNAALAAAMHRDAAAYLRLKPQAKYKDVAKLIEVLTYRDFHNAGQDQL